MLFAVWTIPATANHPASTRIEPIARFRRVAFAPNRVEFTKPPAQNEIIDTYYRPGTKYDVFRGGVKTGTVTMVPTTDFGCEPIERFVERSGEATSGWRSADAVAGKKPRPQRPPAPLSPPAPAERRKLLPVVP